MSRSTPPSTAPRFAVQSSDAFAKAIGYPQSPLDDLLTFHVVFGKTVPDISLNALANLGYAEGGFRRPVYPGETLSTVSEVIGLKESSNRQTGVVYVRSTGSDANGETVLSYCRWVLVKKRDPEAKIEQEHVPTFAKVVDPADLAGALPPLNAAAYDLDLAGSPHRFRRLRGRREDRPCRRHDRRGGRAPDRHAPLPEYRQGAFRRLRRERHTVRSAPDLWRCRHFARPVRSASTVSATPSRSPASMPGATWRRFSRVTRSMPGAKCSKAAELPGRTDIGALRLRTVATKNQPCGNHPDKVGDGYDPAVILDLDYWAFMPR